LELEACRLGVRLARVVIEETSLKITKKMFWTDSQTALSWIVSDHRKFVANRVGDILESSTVAEWNWIPERKNVADEATKKMKNIDLSPTGRWLSGPEFLRCAEDEWQKWRENISTFCAAAGK
jgi:hypothetical protein